MNNVLLQTKLYVPSIRPNVISRPRLIAKLAGQSSQKFVLLSAPAGYGKTTFVTEWVAHLQKKTAVCWLSLDKDDSVPRQFFSYLAAVIKPLTAVHSLLAQYLQSTQPMPIKGLMTAFINDVTPVSTPFNVILDDYHTIDNPEIDEAITFLIDHMPPQMTLVITTREDPSLPLARYRVKGEMSELRADDLRFTPKEATQFLNQMMGLTLSEEEITALDTRTEGWIAGLQLAALSMQGRTDTARFIEAFTGSHRFVLDYLIEEVLQRQPEQMYQFLLQTSILNRLNGSLCDALMGFEASAVAKQKSSRAILDALEKENLFTISLDDQRSWYRYHHLFADVLQSRLVEEESPSHISILHQKASQWYAQNGFQADAIRHSLASQDFEQAAHLIERAWRGMDRTLQSATWLRWAKSLPDDFIRNRPVLSVGYAWALFDAGELETAVHYLDNAEEWLATTDNEEKTAVAHSTKMAVSDEEEFDTLPATIAAARAYHAQAVGDITATIKQAQQALDLLPQEDYLGRAIPYALLGLAYWTSGNLDAAFRALADSMSGFQKAGNKLLAISGTFGLADMRIVQGRLHDAVKLYEQALQLVTTQGEPYVQGTADLYLGLSDLHREMGHQDVANQLLQKSQAVQSQAGEKVYFYRLSFYQAQLNAKQGAFEVALQLLAQAETLFAQIHIPDMRPVSALRARFWVAQGDLSKALRWIDENNLSEVDTLSFLREYEHITLARILIAQFKSEPENHDPKVIQTFLAKLLHAAKDSGRIGSVIEILLLQALVFHAQKDNVAALVALEQALIVAEPEGYCRIFLYEGAPIEQLLSEAAIQGVMPSYVGELLAAFKAEKRETQSNLTSPDQPLLDPLSQRELEILSLIAAGLKNKEIAEQLIISLNTVLYHAKNIYSKLGVNKRMLAVAKAKELDLI